MTNLKEYRALGIDRDFLARIVLLSTISPVMRGEESAQLLRRRAARTSVLAGERRGLAHA